jgi:hypothetical protein
MARRRTRKEKEKTHYSFTISYQPTEVARTSQAHVKGQFKTHSQGQIGQNLHEKKAKRSAQELDIEFIKHDIVKSAALVSLILALEVVIYLAVRMSVL